MSHLAKNCLKAVYSSEQDWRRSFGLKKGKRMEHRGEKTASFVHHMRCGCCGVKLKSFKAAKILQIFFQSKNCKGTEGIFSIENWFLRNASYNLAWRKWLITDYLHFMALDSIETQCFIIAKKSEFCYF